MCTAKYKIAVDGKECANDTGKKGFGVSFVDNSKVKTEYPWRLHCTQAMLQLSSNAFLKTAKL